MSDTHSATDPCPVERTRLAPYPPPIARLYAAELADAERLIYQVPPRADQLAELRARVEYAQSLGASSKGLEHLAAWFRAHPEILAPDPFAGDPIIPRAPWAVRGRAINEAWDAHRGAPFVTLEDIFRAGFGEGEAFGRATPEELREAFADGPGAEPPKASARERIIEASRGGEPVPDGYPFKPFAGQFCRCGLFYAFVAGTVVCHCGHTLTGPEGSVKESIRDLAQAFEGASETAASIGHEPAAPEPAPGANLHIMGEGWKTVDQMAWAAAMERGAETVASIRPVPGVEPPNPTINVWSDGTLVSPKDYDAAVEHLRGGVPPTPIITAADIRYEREVRAWEATGAEPSAETKQRWLAEQVKGVPLGIMPDYIWRERRCSSLAGSIARYLPTLTSGPEFVLTGDRQQVRLESLVKWSAELAEHLRWLADRKAGE